ncbi:MAG TPA: hypothetical protein VK195_10195 [Burkholderiaceae bacterium]|nr:hypothetical protein [Burkholderiaceae bacterium]
MKNVVALISAAFLCAHGAAQSQSAGPAAEKTTPTVLISGKLVIKPGIGLTASLMNSGSSSGNCPIGPDGMPNCEVVIDGKSDGGGGGGGIPNLPADNFGNQAPVTPRILPPPPPGDEDPRVSAFKACQDSHKRTMKVIDDRFNNRVANCVAKNGGGIGPITYGVIDDALGVIGQSCYDRAVNDRDTEVSKANEANVECLQRAKG